MKKCELCGVVRAGMYCESDRASLCWDCDEKVHSANFLVAKHLRVLFCHVCQSQTPWSSCGVRLTPTLSVCESCVSSRSGKVIEPINEESKVENEEDYDDDEEEDEDDEIVIEDSEEDEEEIQVVPWSCCSVSPAEPPPAASGSDSDEAEGSVSSKRLRENVDADFPEADDEVGFDGTASFGSSLRQLKRPRLDR